MISTGFRESMKKNSSVFGLYNISIFYFFSNSLGLLFIIPAIVAKGFSPETVLMVGGVEFLVSMIASGMMRKITFWKYLMVSFGIRGITFIYVILAHTFVDVVVIYVMLGLQSVIFFIPYNMIYHIKVTEDMRATLSAGIFAIEAVLNIFLPGISGYLISLYGYIPVFLISSTITFSGSIYAFLKRDVYGHTLIVDKHLMDIKKKIFFTFDGGWHATYFILIPLYGIISTGNAAAYGIFISYLAFAGSMSSLLISRYSDRKKERKNIFTIACIVGGTLTLLASVRFDFIIWAIIASGIVFTLYIIIPFGFTISGEMGGKIEYMMVTREMYYNLGRSAVLFFAFFLLYAGFNILYSFLLPAAFIFTNSILVRKIL